MDFHFIGINSGSYATIIDSNEKPRFICFKNVKCAKKYATYISEHKAKFGTWPEVNLSTPSIKVRKSYNHIPTESSIFMDLLEISYKNFDDLDSMSIATGVNYFYCHEFVNENPLSLRIRGQEIDGFVNNLMFIDNLEYNLKNM